MPDLDQGRVLRGKEVGEARLGHPRVPRRAVEHQRGDELRVVDAGRLRAQAVAQRERQQVAREVRVHRLGGRPRQALLLGRRIAAAAGQRPGRARRPAGPRPVRLLAGHQLVPDPAGGGVDEGARAVDHLRGLGLGQLAAHRGQRAQAALVVGHVARQAALQRQDATEIGGQHGPGELALDQHQHGLVAEVLLEALGGVVGLRAAVGERLGGGAGLQPQRQRGAAQGGRRGEGQHHQRPSRDDARDAAKGLLAHGVSLGSASPASAHSPSGSSAGKTPPWPTWRPSGDCGSQGGAAFGPLPPLP